MTAASGDDTTNASDEPHRRLPNGDADRPISGARLALGVSGGGLLFAWCFGLGLLLRAPRPLSVELPVQARHPEREHNLASYVYGPTLRASSYFKQVLAQHHPAYVVDERTSPTLVEKWASDVGDRAPWVEIRWRGEHELSKVAISHAGAVEGADSNTHAYRLTCLRNGRAPVTLDVSNNHLNIVEHPLVCSNARGIRLDFVPNAAGALTRIFEVQAWGR